LSLIALTYLVSAVGSFIALQCARGIPQGYGRVNHLALWASSVAVGGGAIWYMHFIGMAAFVPPRVLSIRYDVLTTIASMLAAIFVAAAGLFIVGRNPKNVVNLFVGGTIAGSGVAIMHYTGMGAMRMQAIIEWDPTIVAVSVGIAIAAATAALWLTFHTQHLIQRVAAALVMAIAVCGMHYTGMYAGTYVCVAESAATHSSLSIGGSVFPYLVAIVGASLLTAVSILDALALPEPNPAWG
jgi:NO-binding membrane sensor protein with MHYT domain